MSLLDIPVSITAVIVLYQQSPNESVAFTTLQQAYAFTRSTGLRLQILIYDNTPSRQAALPLPEGVLYVAAPQNDGLATAYNYAAALAETHGSQWLLTLDQDTHLPTTFLQQMGTRASDLANTPMIAAIVPQITGGGRMLSPNSFTAGLPFWYPTGFQGVPPKDVFAFNSASLIRLSALKQVGGYHPWFWLDNSDAFLFRRLHRYGKRVFVAGETQVDHNFSMMDMKNRVSAKRYSNILLAESAFWDLEMNTIAGIERTVRLIVRFFKQLRRSDPVELRSITETFLKRRLFWSRRQRLQQWEASTQSLFPGLLPYDSYQKALRFTASGARYRPKISVCMAAYNNEAYIALQIESVLPQLGPEDELIVVDDASTDETVKIIQSLRSPLIRLIQHRVNQGVVQTFEEAVSNATGEILFLADGDDIWADTKVELFLNAFQQSPEVNVVTSRVAFIDQKGAPIRNNMYDNRKKFEAGFWQNVLRNHFQGSAMAFRASLLDKVLPFPKGSGFLHDHWIGTRNALAGNSALCLEEPLLFYRRHAGNLSNRLPRLQQVQVRASLLWAHLSAKLRQLFESKPITSTEQAWSTNPANRADKIGVWKE